MSRRLDVLAAVRVLGQSPPEGYEQVGDEWHKEEQDCYDDGSPARSFSISVWPPRPSTSIADAMEMLTSREWDWKITNYYPSDAGHMYRVKIMPVDAQVGDSAIGFTLTEVITLACLRAVGVPEAEIAAAMEESGV